MEVSYLLGVALALPSPLAPALGGAPDEDRTRQGPSDGPGLRGFVLDDDNSVKSSDLPDFKQPARRQAELL
jgi:hypothetical protein